MKLKLLLYSVLLSTCLGFSQELKLTESAQISVLTIGSGTNLNDAFGHNAFRIKDPSIDLDVAYGYGGYDFDTPNFYLKFAQGKLKYLITRHSFNDFYRTYVYFNRSIKEQVLNLTQEQKQALYGLLVENYKPENRGYLYDFFYDNCATRIRDVVQNATNNSVTFSTPEEEQKTFRSLIYEHVDKNSWGSFGIDVALGSVIDKTATPNEYMFLPTYIHEFFGGAMLSNGEPLVSEHRVLYSAEEKKYSEGFIFSPLIILGLISLFILWITYRDYKKQQKSKWLDTTIFSITGLIGILLLLLWFATDHSGTAQNYNLLWAFPLNLILLAALIKTNAKPWVRRYIKLLVIFIVLLIFHWIMGIQVYAITLIPLLIAIALRYSYLIVFLKKHN